VTNGNLTTGAGGPCLFWDGVNANGIPDGSTLSIWNGISYDSYLSDSQSSSYWDDGNGNPISAPPTISVGQGFFLSPATPFTWTVGL
jgi:hypothetical protein